MDRQKKVMFGDFFFFFSLLIEEKDNFFTCIFLGGILKSHIYISIYGVFLIIVNKFIYQGNIVKSKGFILCLSIYRNCMDKKDICLASIELVIVADVSLRVLIYL